jgi:hypothetical protein
MSFGSSYSFIMTLTIAAFASPWLPASGKSVPGPEPNPKHVPLFILIETKQGTDENTVEARNNDTHRRDAVLPSGAQMLSTDFPASEPAASGFTVALPGAVAARCNPVLQAKGCRDALLDLP